MPFPDLGLVMTLFTLGGRRFRLIEFVNEFAEFPRSSSKPFKGMFLPVPLFHSSGIECIRFKRIILPGHVVSPVLNNTEPLNVCLCTRCCTFSNRQQIAGPIEEGCNVSSNHLTLHFMMFERHINIKQNAILEASEHAVLTCRTCFDRIEHHVRPLILIGTNAGVPLDFSFWAFDNKTTFGF